MWLVFLTGPAQRLAGFSALTLGFFDVAGGLPQEIQSYTCFSALTLGFFDVA